MSSAPKLFNNFYNNAMPSPLFRKPTAKNELIWGRLNSIRQAEEDLIEVQLTGQDAPPVKALVSSELEGILQRLIGQEVTIGFIFGKWSCREVPA